MAAGKSLWVKLRYRIPSLVASTSSQAWDPTETGGNILRTSLASSVFDTNLDYNSVPFFLQDMSTDPNMIATSIEHPNPVPLPTPPMTTLTTAEILAQRKNRKNLTSSASSKRSMSTPNARTHSTGEPMMTMAEKRRNKLGYHRTSIACSHCRRRKIRCLAAPDDPHERCVNCIRLKKECTFFPVEQQPPIERRSRNPTTKSEKRTSTAEPLMYGHPMLDPHDHPNPFQAVPLGSQAFSTATAFSNSGVVSPMTRGKHSSENLVEDKGLTEPLGSVDHRASFDFNAPTQHSQFSSPFHHPSPLSAGHSSPGDVPQAYWGRHTDSPLTPAYSPHLSAPTTAMNSIDARNSIGSFVPTSNARNDSTWSAPARSASIGVAEDFTAAFPKHHSQPHALNMDYRRRASDMQPPPLITSAASTRPSISDANMTPMSAPVSSPPDHWGLASGWGTLPSSAVTKPTDFGCWYPETALAKVQEEDIPPTYGEQPAIVYPDGEPQ